MLAICGKTMDGEDTTLPLVTIPLLGILVGTDKNVEECTPVSKAISEIHRLQPTIKDTCEQLF